VANQLSTPPSVASVPGIATAESGAVILDGPGGVAITMTPEAAAQTGRNLIEAAEAAMQQGNN